MADALVVLREHADELRAQLGAIEHAIGVLEEVRAERPPRAAADVEPAPFTPPPPRVTRKPGRGVRITDEQWARARIAWDDVTKSITDVAAAAGAKVSTLYNYAAAHGWPKRPKRPTRAVPPAPTAKVTPEHWVLARRMWDKNVSAIKIGETIGCTGVHVGEYAVAHGWPKRDRGAIHRQAHQVAKDTAARSCHICYHRTQKDPCDKCGTPAATPRRKVA